MSWWQYLILVNIYLVLFYGFYALLLRRETFFQLNRIYLVSAGMLSFFIPLIQADWVKNLFITQEVKYSFYGNAININQLKPAQQAYSIGQLLACFYIAGVLFLTVKLVWQLIMLNRIIGNPKTDRAYSFFKKINVDASASDSNIIAAHEQVHAKQWHSADVLIIEAVMIINWFNPIVYFYRRAIKHIHEFIADSQVIKTASNKAEYALLLLNQTFNQQPSHQLLSHFFNHSLLKQRIIMLQKSKSQRIVLFKYLLSAPLFILMLILSSATINNSTAIKSVNFAARSVFDLPLYATTAPQGNFCVLPMPNTQQVVLIDPDTIKKKENKVVLTEVKLIPPPSGTDTTITIKNTSQVFTAVEVEPTYPGGLERFNEFVAANIKYPAKMIADNIQGKVIVTFVVEKDGSLSNVKALRGPGYGAEEEAVRVVSASPKWIAGVQNGSAVRVQYTIPIAFGLVGKVEGFSTVWNSDTTKKGVTMVRLNGKPDEALVVIDGKVTSYDDMKLLDVNTIESITVLKDASAKAIYGKKGEKGVIVIATKKK